MRKQIIHFGQDPNQEKTYQLFISAAGSVSDFFKFREGLEKILFKTEMKDSELLAKFKGRYLAVSNMVR